MNRFFPRVPSLVVMTVALVAGGHARGLAGFLYWADAQGIWRANLDELKAEKVKDNFTPAGIAADAGAGKIYWTEVLPIAAPIPPGLVQRASLDGSGAERLVGWDIPPGYRGLESPAGIALRLAPASSTAGKMYWTDTVTNDIRSANLDGSRPEVLLAGLPSPYGIAVDPVDEKMYWTHSPTGFEKGAIQRANLDGSQLENLLPQWPGPTTGIALDPVAKKMYWGYIDPNIDSIYAGMIKRSDLDGSHVEHLVHGLLSPDGIALDLAAGKIYWSDAGRAGPPGPTYAGKIMRANLDGSEPTVLLDGLVNPRGLALVLSSIPRPGDANGDGKVDDLDASILAANWQRTGGATWGQADFNGDGNVNDLDASILAANWQYGVGAAVPEPGVLALAVGAAGVGLLWRWRRRMLGW